MNASRALRMALAVATLLLAASGTTPTWADAAQDSFCQFTNKLEVTGRKTTLKADLATIVDAVATMKSFFVTYAALDQQRHACEILLADGKAGYDVLVPPRWASLSPSVARFSESFNVLYQRSADALAATERKNATLVKKATSMDRWEHVMASQAHSADKSAASTTETDVLNHQAPPSTFTPLLRALLIVHLGLQTWPAMLDLLTTAARELCTKVRSMMPGKSLATLSGDNSDLFAMTAEDFANLEAFIRKWAPAMKAASDTIKAAESSLAPVKQDLDALATSLTPLADLKGLLDSAMAEKLCLPKSDPCFTLGEYPEKSQSWGQSWGSGSGASGMAPAKMRLRVERRLGKLFAPIQARLTTAKVPNLTAMNAAADKLDSVIGTMDAFFLALEAVIDIPMDGNADVLQDLTAQLGTVK